MKLRIVTWNLWEGGLDGSDDARLRAQISTLGELRPDLLGLQEARWGARSSRLLNETAHALGMTGRTLAWSNHHGHLAQFVRERPGLHLLEERHDESSSYWHALGVVRLLIDGLGEVDFLNAHLSPSSRGQRLTEAETFSLWKDLPAIACGVFNATAVSHDDLAAGDLPAICVDAALDERPAVVMELMGFIDAGARADDSTPTVGADAGQLAYRCDRILWRGLPAVKVTHYEVVSAVHPKNGRRLSDHDLVVADLEFDHQPTTRTWALGQPQRRPCFGPL